MKQSAHQIGWSDS